MHCNCTSNHLTFYAISVIANYLSFIYICIYLYCVSSGQKVVSLSEYFVYFHPVSTHQDVVGRIEYLKFTNPFELAHLSSTALAKLAAVRDMRP